jgi:hypothetical protein
VFTNLDTRCGCDESCGRRDIECNSTITAGSANVNCISTNVFKRLLGAADDIEGRQEFRFSFASQM